MKKLFSPTMLLLLLTLVLSLPLLAQEDDPPVIKEAVSIVNVEVPVRVFDGDRPVPDLKKEDFLLTEGDEVQKINGFFIDQRLLNTGSEPKAGESALPPRHFTLIMRLTQMNDNLKTGMSTFARSVLHPGDRVEIWINDRALLTHVFRALAEFETWLFTSLKPYVSDAKHELDAIVRKIESRIQQYNVRKMQGDISAPDTLLFLEEYLGSFRQYKQQYLTPDLSMYYRYAARLQRIQNSKWVLSFYQYHLFPKLKIGGPLLRELETMVHVLTMGRSEDAAYARMISSLMQRLYIEFNSSADASSDVIAKIFYKVNASFHAVFIPTFQDTLLENIELKAINSEMENSLQHLIHLTGGSLQNTGNITSAIESIARKEDILYLLTYAPANPEQRGRIEVKLPRHPFTVRYDDQMRQDYLKEFLAREEKREQSLLIENLRLENGSVHFTIKGFLTQELKSDAQKTGSIYVVLRISNCDQVTVLEQKATMKANKKEISISIPISQAIPDCANIVVEVQDLISSSTTSGWIKKSL